MNFEPNSGVFREGMGCMMGERAVCANSSV